MILALTGATGFVGGHVLSSALAAGHRVRALTRRPQAPRDGVEWIDGTLAEAAALDRLVGGAAAVIHVAGVVNASDRAGFAAGNVAGTRAIVTACANARVARFVHISSLSAREPALSDYGWSKAEAETVVEASGLDWDIVRPPAIYGPGDLDMRDLFRMAGWGFALLPPPGRISVIAAEDLARLLLALATGPGAHACFEVDDGSGGWTHAGFARAVGEAVGRRVLPLPLPGALLSLAARADRWLRGADAKLTPDRVGYLCHPDWTIDASRRPSPTLWTPRIETVAGLAATARWYRAHGLL